MSNQYCTYAILLAKQCNMMNSPRLHVSCQPTCYQYMHMIKVHRINLEPGLRKLFSLVRSRNHQVAINNSIVTKNSKCQNIKLGNVVEEDGKLKQQSTFISSLDWTIGLTLDLKNSIGEITSAKPLHAFTVVREHASIPSQPFLQTKSA